jgi:hypothetical protein
MKVVKAEDVKGPEVNQIKPQIDEAKVAELQEKFEAMQNDLQTKKYDVSLNKEQTTFLFEDFYNNVDWKGYESYAIAETHSKLSEIVEKGELNGKTSTEIIEAIFHFLKNHLGKGVKSATVFRQICDQFALPMKEINEDRQALRDLSLELVSAEQGIPVEQLVDQLNRQAALQNGQG